MRLYRLLISLTLLVGVLIGPVAQAQDGYPRPQEAYLNDYAGLLSPEDAARTRALLVELKEQRGIEATIVTVESIEAYNTGAETIEAFATGLFNAWGIGHRQRNDGVLLLVAVKERQVRIEVGTGYGSAQNEKMQEVIDEHILPSFRQGRMSQGIYRGARAIVGQLTGEWPPDLSGVTAEPSPGWLASTYNTLTGIPLFFYLGGAAVAFGLYRYARRRSRPKQRCPNCQAKMRLLDDAAGAAYLDAGQRLEKQLQAIKHQVWLCPSCGQPAVVSQPRAFTPIDRCPQCDYKTVKTSTRTETQPTYRRSGKQRVLKQCQQCDYRHEYTISLSPKKRTTARRSRSRSSGYTDDFSSYSSSSGSDSHFDGGSSSGDGASGSW